MGNFMSTGIYTLIKEHICRNHCKTTKKATETKNPLKITISRQGTAGRGRQEGRKSTHDIKDTNGRAIECLIYTFED